jgi:hypothetical protein
MRVGSFGQWIVEQYNCVLEAFCSLVLSISTDYTY